MSSPAVFSLSEANVARILCDSHDPSATAYTVIGPDLSSAELTYGDLRSESERLAAGLASIGVEKGDRVATLMGKSRELLVTVLAIWRIGAVYVPLFTAFAPASIFFRLKQSDCKVIVCDPDQRTKLNPGEDIPENASWKIVMTGRAGGHSLSFEELLKATTLGFLSYTGTLQDPFIEIYTSGTTGKPKGVAIPIRALESFKAYAHYGLNLMPSDVFWNAADPGWAYGLYYGILASLLTGAPSLLSTCRFSVATTFAIFSQFGVTNFAAAPTVYRSMQASELEVPSNLCLRCASSAGEPLTPEINVWAGRALGINVHDHYGQTEAGMLINNHHHPDLKRPIKPGSMGHPMPGWKMTVLKQENDDPAGINELGRVAVNLSASPLAWFSGYLGESSRSREKFSPDGRWYFTGDIGQVDEEGYYYFASRDDDLIIMAGYRISPIEVESVLLSHPAVRECAVIASPDQVRGEVLEAMVVPHQDFVPSERLTATLQEYIKTRYSAHAYPRRVHYVNSLPRTLSGKIQRFVLRQRLAQEHAEKNEAS